MSHQSKSPRTPIRFLFENSLFLVGGAILALVWANKDAKSYQDFIHYPLPIVGHLESAGGGHGTETESEGHEPVVHKSADAHSDDTGSSTKETHHGEVGSHSRFNLHFLINDFMMALFFAIAAKEVWESLLPGGDLSNLRKAATPLLATVGGIVGPASLFLVGAAMTGQMSTLGGGWAIPCATDIAFSYLVARLIFGPGHPAIGFLLLLAIADDAAGLVILAVFYPNPEFPVDPKWFLLTAGAVAAGFLLRRARVHSFWWYLLIPGALSWFSFFKAGIHPALGLVPIIPTMPHAHTDLGIFARQELHRGDTLNEFEHWWKNPVELILGLFGLVNAGVVLSNFGVGTWLVLIGLIVGKPLGITLFTLLAEKVFKLEMPAGMNYRHVFTLGMIAAIGFTVALFVSVAAFPVPPTSTLVQDSVKMGALLSFGAAILAFITARLLGIRPIRPHAEGEKKQAEQVQEKAEECLA